MFCFAQEINDKTNLDKTFLKSLWTMCPGVGSKADQVEISKHCYTA